MANLVIISLRHVTYCLFDTNLTQYIDKDKVGDLYFLNI